MSRLWVLGASDPEMVMIEKLLRDCGERVAYALGENGQRVHPGNAYRDASAIVDNPDAFDQVVLVECDLIRFEEQLFGLGGEPISEANVIRIDHHRPGDPGYGLPPEQFLEASSIGQVLVLLSETLDMVDIPEEFAEEGWLDGAIGIMTDLSTRRTDSCESKEAWGIIPTKKVRLAAAADHCLESAYRGKCPGVDPDELMRWRVETRAAFQGRSASDVLADIEAARKALRDCIEWQDNYANSNGGGGPIADMRGADWPELPEAACRDGIPFLADATDRDGRKKVVLQAAWPALVESFMAGRIVSGLTDYYGDPARGFAGGYRG